MATTQTLINASAISTQVIGRDPSRRMLYIRNYGASAQTIWVLFGGSGTATAGLAGELEVVPGGEYTFGGPLPFSKQTLPGGFNLPVCPQEEVYVVTSTGTATGTILTQ